MRRPIKLKNLAEARKYFKKTQPVKFESLENQVEKIRKKQVENETRLNYIMKKLLEIDLKIH